jgi:hypothetical protein
MLFIYGLVSDDDAVVARRLYQEMYPGRRYSDGKTFLSIHRRLCKQVNFVPRLQWMMWKLSEMELWRDFRRHETCLEFGIV